VKGEWRIVWIIAAICLLISLPNMIAFGRIAEIYIDPEMRSHSLDAILFVRDSTSNPLSDIAIADVYKQGSSEVYVFHYVYHGKLDRSRYDDLDEYYWVTYNGGKYSMVRSG
jgi:hypothetical protein